MGSIFSCQTFTPRPRIINEDLLVTFKDFFFLMQKDEHLSHKISPFYISKNYIFQGAVPYVAIYHRFIDTKSMVFNG